MKAARASEAFPAVTESTPACNNLLRIEARPAGLAKQQTTTEEDYGKERR